MLSGTAPALYGLLGYPLGHTLSPAMQQAAFSAHGLEGTYLALPVPPERLEGALAGVRAWRLPGLNVTVPHKTAVLPLLDGLTPEASAVGAVNTLYWDGDRLMGDNTDVAGFALSSDAQELACHVHQRTHVTLSMVAERGDQLCRHELGRAGLGERVFEALLQLVGRRALQSHAHADPATQGKQLIGAKAFQQPPVAGQHHRQEDVAVEPGGGQKAQLGQHLRHHLLGLVDD